MYAFFDVCKLLFQSAMNTDLSTKTNGDLSVREDKKGEVIQSRLVVPDVLLGT